MALIVRIDVDRPYGKHGVVRHIASRVASDYFLLRMAWLRYLDELKTILRILNANGRVAHVFFRKCTYPSPEVCELMEAGGHKFGLHLENSRDAETFHEEHGALERVLGRRVVEFSKHGSGRLHLGRHHFAPYEPERYLPWARQAGMKLFFGNLEDPELKPVQDAELLYYPSAFWLEPYWRDTKRFPIEWLLSEARDRDVVMLLHPDNVTASPEIMREFLIAIETLETAADGVLSEMPNAR
ncbi:MAG TPA: hypothetical protein VMW15_04750 [Terracidiphilus sp.]|nr:hypothetical protein [Terracidiphilus sp.]